MAIPAVLHASCSSRRDGFGERARRRDLQHPSARLKFWGLLADPVGGMDQQAPGARRHLRLLGKRLGAVFETTNSSGKGYVRNVSPEGMFLRTDVLPAPGEPVRVIFVDSQGRTVAALGSVSWNTGELDPAKDAKPGFGMRIEHVSGEYLAFYEDLRASFDPPDERAVDRGA